MSPLLMQYILVAGVVVDQEQLPVQVASAAVVAEAARQLDLVKHAPVVVVVVLVMTQRVAELELLVQVGQV